MQVLIFGGTMEGRVLAHWCAGEGLAATLCVATDYGATMAVPRSGLEVRVGRLDVGGMAALMERGYTHVVDATHPYAAEATRHVRAAAAQVRLPCLRLLRAGTEDGTEEGMCHTVQDAEGAADLLETLPGNLLLTTGSKDLGIFARPGLLERSFPRVLPTLDSLKRCLDLGFPPSHILCMQGPFSCKLNEALLEQYDIAVLVTKNTGGPGGYFEKTQAVHALGRTLVVIARPTDETGLTLDEIQNILGGRT